MLALCLVVTAEVAVQAQDAGLSFQPYVLPIELSWSSSSGLGVAFKGPKIPTPLGTISGSLSLHKAQRRYPSKRVLIVVAGAKTYVYDLGRDHFTLRLPRNIRGHCTVEYADGDVYLKIPHPERLAGPQVLAGNANRRGASIRSGSFTLLAGDGFAFGIGKVQPADSSDVSFRGGTHIYADGLLDLGPIDMRSVRSVPAHANLLVSSLTLLTGKPRYFAAAEVKSGHVYAVAIRPNGPYALVRVTDVSSGNDAASQKVRCSYLFQANGSTEF